MKTLSRHGGCLFLISGLLSMPVSANLLVNGDFSAGNTGFSTNYNFSSVGLGAARTYTITTDPRLNHAAAKSYGDHTTGTGLMMAVNGATTANVRLWEQTVAVNGNTDYTFEFWASSWTVSGGLATCQVYINGIAAGPAVQFPGTAGVWASYATDWNSGVNTSAVITLMTIAPFHSGGDDFALDDFSFDVPEPAALLLLGWGCIVLRLKRSR
jgi:hypothetical protein